MLKKLKNNLKTVKYKNFYCIVKNIFKKYIEIKTRSFFKVSIPFVKYISESDGREEEIVYTCVVAFSVYIIILHFFFYFLKFYF